MNQLPHISFCKKILYSILLIFNVEKFISIEKEHNLKLPEMNEDRELPRAIKLRSALLRSLFIVFIAGLLGMFISTLISLCNYQFSKKTVSIIQILGSLILLWSTLFLRGWEIQSYIGETLTERMNQFIYRSLYFIGTLLLVMTLM